MAASTTLTRLLHDLKAVSSPLDRMRVAARAWRSLRRLRPEERQVLATQVGLEGAEEILEGLGRGEKRLAPVLVLRALEKAKKADPSQLRGLVTGLRDRGKRGAILKKWLDSVSEGLDDDEAAEETPEAPAEAKPPAPPRESSPSPVEPEKPPPAAKPPRAIPVAQPAAVIPVASAPPPAPAPTVKPAAAAPRQVQPRRVPPPLPLPVPVPVPMPRPKPASAAAKPVPQAVRRPAVAVSTGEPLANRLHGTDGLMLRFRLLRSGLDRNGGDRLGDIPHLLEAFPDGWARRRALAALLRRRIPADLERALALIDEMESSAARRWCLGTILEHWKLSSEQQDQLRRRRRSG